jgi:signal transduction histidine kinase
LAACDLDEGLAERDFVAAWAEDSSSWESAEGEVIVGLDDLVARGLLVAVTEKTGGIVQAGGTVRIPLSGAVRALRPTAKDQLIRTLLLLERSRRSRQRVDEADSSTAGTSGAAASDGWTQWHRNRFLTLPAYAKYREAELRGAEGAELSDIAEQVNREVRELDPAAVVAGAGEWVSDLGALIPALAEDFRIQYGDVHLDVRCPGHLLVGVPERILRVVLYEVLDNAAEAVAGQSDAVIQVNAIVDSPEVLVDILDSGGGLPAEARGRRVFTLDWTTRGPGRGAGLYRARQLLRACSNPEVEVSIEPFDAAHPTLTGAAFQIVLPEGAGARR